MNRSLRNAVAAAKTIAITGHKHPDGDCVGSCMAMYYFLKDNFADKTVRVYLETPPENLAVLPAWDEIDTEFLPPEKPYDLFLVLDCSSEDRFPCAKEMVAAAKHTFVVDHHMTNTHFADEEIVLPEASSTCEVLFGLLSENAITTDIATALYMGIVHDTGVFKYECCRENTMKVAGKLLSKGVDAQRLIDDTFYRKSYLQNLVIGYSVLNSKLLLGGKMICTVLTAEELAKFGAVAKDTEGVIDQLRLTEGIEVAMFAREDEPNRFKVSLRAISKVNVAAICQTFGGGGHRLAAGCNVDGPVSAAIEKIASMVESELAEKC